jgi:hypothetical protein
MRFCEPVNMALKTSSTPCTAESPPVSLRHQYPTRRISNRPGKNVGFDLIRKHRTDSKKCSRTKLLTFFCSMLALVIVEAGENGNFVTRSDNKFFWIGS